MKSNATSKMVVKNLVNDGKALLAKNASASIVKCSNRTSTVGSTIPTLRRILSKKNEKSEFSFKQNFIKMTPYQVY